MTKTESTLVGFCPACEAYEEPYVKGLPCPGYGWEGGWGCPTKSLHKRRFYICRSDDCGRMGYTSARGLIEHQKNDHGED